MIAPNRSASAKIGQLRSNSHGISVQLRQICSDWNFLIVVGHPSQTVTWACYESYLFEPGGKGRTEVQDHPFTLAQSNGPNPSLNSVRAPTRLARDSLEHGRGFSHYYPPCGSSAKRTVQVQVQDEHVTVTSPPASHSAGVFLGWLSLRLVPNIGPLRTLSQAVLNILPSAGACKMSGQDVTATKAGPRGDERPAPAPRFCAARHRPYDEVRRHALVTGVKVFGDGEVLQSVVLCRRPQR